MKGLGSIQSVVLTDGTRVRVRPIRPDDAPRMQAFATRLSPRTIFLRTNMVRPASLSDSEAASATRVDYRSSMALVAVSGEESDERIIAVARYADSQPGAGQTEVGIVVEDAYQQRGIGAQLLIRLAAYAREHGITHLIGNVAVDNTPVRSMVRRTGLHVDYLYVGYGECQMIMPLTRAAGRAHLSARAGDIVQPLLPLPWNRGSGFARLWRR